MIFWVLKYSQKITSDPPWRGANRVFDPKNYIMVSLIYTVTYGVLTYLFIQEVYCTKADSVNTKLFIQEAAIITVYREKYLYRT